MKKVHKEVGQIIRDHRVAVGLTQLGLAEKLGYDTPQFVSLFERGLSKVPIETIGQLCAILSIPEKKITNLLVASYKVALAEKISKGKRQPTSNKQILKQAA